MAEIVIHDGNYQQYITGYTGAERRRTAFGECRAAPAIDEDWLIPRSQWDDEIARKDEEKSWLWDRTQDRIPCQYQNGINYCHAFAQVMAQEAAEVVAGHEYVRLSAMSIGGPITGWRNRGAYPEADIEQAAKYGACEYSYQDSEFSMRPSRWQDGWEENRKLHRVAEYLDGLLRGKAFDALVTSAIRNKPSLPSYAWWGHAVTGGWRVRKQNGVYQAMIRNPHGPTWGENGFGWLAEGKGTPDICLFILNAIRPTD